MSYARSNGIMGGLRSSNAGNNGFINLGRTTHQQNKDGFSIHDAFEEEETDADEVIKVYGNAPATNNVVPKPSGSEEGVKIQMDNDSNRQLKYTDDTSRDSDSLIQEYSSNGGSIGMGHSNNLPIYYSTTTGGGSTANQYTTCWRHPKVRENWRTVLAAFALLFVGTGLVIMGAFSVSETNNTSQGAVFFIAGVICFIPGAYHVVYIWLAARGFRGFDFYHLPLFT